MFSLCGSGNAEDGKSITLSHHEAGRYAHLMDGGIRRGSTDSCTHLIPIGNRSFDIHSISSDTEKSCGSFRGKFTGWNGCVCATIIIGMVLFVSTGVILMAPANQDYGPLCLKQSDMEEMKFYDDDNQIQKLNRVVKDGQFMYCTKSPNQMELLLNAVINKTNEFGYEDMNNLPKKLFNGKVVSAHVLISGFMTPINTAIPNLVKLSAENSLTHLDGVGLGPYRLIIRTKGTYFVYSKIEFEIHPRINYHATNDQVKMYHKVVWNRRTPKLKGKDELLLNEHIDNLEHKKLDFSSYVSGIFQLDKGDEIGVTVSSLDYISRIKKKNFVGLFILR
ncbi:hypothetical protein SNE40_001137 [Patella caerulea]|uniref:THD domain-containing protein n=1 Tax=Patella caerulea TaxID=87958 RepID=A0AAN8K6J8_PATCE